MFQTGFLPIISSLLLYTQQQVNVIQYKTLDDVQKTCPKHVQFYSKDKYEKVVHLIGFIIRIYEGHSIRNLLRATKVHRSWYKFRSMSFIPLHFRYFLTMSPTTFVHSSYLGTSLIILPRYKNYSRIHGHSRTTITVPCTVKPTTF